MVGRPVVVVLGRRQVKPESMRSYTPYEGLISTNQNDRKLDVCDRKLEGSHSILG